MNSEVVRSSARPKKSSKDVEFLNSLSKSPSSSHLEQTAFDYVDEAIKNASVVVREETKTKLESIPCKEEENEVPNITWPSCGQFTIEFALQKLEEFIKTWNRDSSWLHHSDCLSQEDHEYDVRYKFRVRWSQPTNRVPIPRAIACVYFTISVSKIKPRSSPVDVYFIFEGNRLVHRPGVSKFREIWLENIITNKLTALSSVTF